jgi:hypothetical protein
MVPGYLSFIFLVELEFLFVFHSNVDVMIYKLICLERVWLMITKWQYEYLVRRTTGSS